MLFSVLPISVFAAESEGGDTGGDTNNGSGYTVEVESLYQYGNGKDNTYRMEGWAKPDTANVFYFRIFIDGVPEDTDIGEVTAYYRTVDESAVAAWGDYEGVTAEDEKFVMLTKDNGYSQTVAVQSTPSDYRVSLVEPKTQMDGYNYDRAKTTPRYIGRIFYFELYDVKGDAKLSEEAKGNNPLNRVTALLNAEYEFAAGYGAYPTGSQIRVSNDKFFYNCIDTSSSPVSKGKTEGSVDLSFSEEYKKLVESGVFKPYLFIEGELREGWFEHDENVHFTLFYRKNGVDLPALTLHMEGEFDDYKELGPELAFQYYYDENEGYEGLEDGFVEDNFRGFAIYGNDGKLLTSEGVSQSANSNPKQNYTVRLSDEKISTATYGMNSVIKNRLVRPFSTEIRHENAWGEPKEFSFALPSDFVNSNTFKYRFESEGGNKRYISGVNMDFKLATDKEPEFERVNGKPLVKTNLDTIREGEKLQITMRFDTLTTIFNDYQNESDGRLAIKAKVNGNKDVTFIRVNSNANDTWVFEAEVPSDIYKITSITNLKMTGIEAIETIHSSWTSSRSGHLTWDRTDLSGIFFVGYNTDLRPAVVNVNLEKKESPAKQVNVKISVKPDGATGNFSDSVTVYYQWSDNKDIPKSYDNKVIFDYKNDATAERTLVGTGNGPTYLHLKTVTRYGVVSYSVKGGSSLSPDNVEGYEPYGPYHLDSKPPSFNKESYTVTPTASGWKYSVTTRPNDGDGSGVASLELYCVKESIAEDGTVTKKDDEKLETFTFDEGDSTTYEREVTAERVGVGDKQIKDVEFFWITTDKLGNVSEPLLRHTLTFDTNEYIELAEGGTGPVNGDTEKIETIDDFTYLRHSVNLICSFTFELAEEPDGFSQDNYKVKVVNKDGVTSYNSSLDYNYESKKFTAAIEMPSAGLYKISLILVDKDVNEVKTSKTYCVYSTMYAEGQEADATATKLKIEAGTLLKNKVYQIPTTYYYLDANGNLIKGNYGDEKLPASFSSKDIATEYVRYMEYQDLQLIQLDSEIATELNREESHEYNKATGEPTAEEGDYWIRYKKSTWMPDSVAASNWCYYYYSPSDATIQLSKLSTSLKTAINEVVERIVEKGTVVALTDLSIVSGASATYLDKQGRPYLKDTQIHFDYESVNKTKCGSPFAANGISFNGDTAIFNVRYETETETETEVPCMVGSLTLPEDSRFQYKSNSNDGWTLGTGNTFDELFKGDTRTGKYYIRELAKEGVCQYTIFLDKACPILKFSTISPEGKITAGQSTSNKTNINAKKVTLDAIEDVDNFAYVAIYKSSDNSLIGMYTKLELESSAYVLENGAYTVVVADRSGNSFQVDVRVSDTPLECTVTNVESRYVRVICNRLPNHILRYEIYLNGKLESSVYSTDAVFKKEGKYRIYIKDIYGNVFETEETLERVNPTATWKYLGADNRFYEYKIGDNVIGFKMAEGSSDNEYIISSSTKQRFTLDGNYLYEFIGIEPKHTVDMLGTTVTIEKGESFKLKIYYKDHPERYTLYSSVIDVTPPTINVSTDIYMPKGNEIAYFEELIEKAEKGEATAGAIELSKIDIGYTVEEERTIRIADGDTVSSNMIKVKATDTNGLYSFKIYLDGTLLTEQTADSGFSQVVLSRFGSYRMVAVDSLGNTSEFNFKNGAPDEFNYIVDGKNRPIDINAHLNFENGVYKNVEYGNSDFRIKLNKDATVFLAVTSKDGVKTVYVFGVENGELLEYTYELQNDNGEWKVVGISTKKLSISEAPKNKDIEIAKGSNYTVYAVISDDGKVTFKVYAPSGDSVLTVNARVEIGGDDFFYVKSTLSKKKSNLTLKNENGMVIDTDLSGKEITINSGFTIDESSWGAEFVSSVSVYYSKVNDIDPAALDGRSNIYEKGKTYSSEGFYLIKAVNLFGNESIFRVYVSDGFGATASVEFKDGLKLHYTAGYASTLCSDKTVTLEVHASNIDVEVLKDGSRYEPKISAENNIIYISFSEDGSYAVTISDPYGNTIIKTVEINSKGTSFNESLLYGYNEKALKKAEGYTNKKLSVDKAVLESEGLYYFAIKYGEKLDVLYDTLSETKVTLDEKKLADAIGADGDGVYTVIFRNRYGSIVNKVINYRATPTLKLERTTSAAIEKEAYSLERALEIGFWANSSLIFSTEAQAYEFKLNGTKTDCPRTISFSNSDEDGNIEYTVSYIDEYGFEYSFKAYLVRRDIQITVPQSIKGIDISGVLTTKDNISISFPNNVSAVYTLNGGKEIPYTADTILKRDGLYRFTVTDYAGNSSTVSLKKDTSVEFRFLDRNSNESIICGGVVNSQKVMLDALNGEKLTVASVLLNGVAQSAPEKVTFDRDGKWEVILRDELGNEAYFNFYIITQSKNGFEYVTPYEYKITEIWYDKGDGNKVLYSHFVNQGETGSSINLTENGSYTVLMVSDATGRSSEFTVTVNTLAPNVTLVGCADGETTLNDVTFDGCNVGDTIKVYKITKHGEVLVSETKVTSASMKMPVINEGGEYRVVVESEAGVTTELKFTRKHVMNTAGSIFFVVIIGVAVVALLAGQIYRSKSKTDE